MFFSQTFVMLKMMHDCYGNCTVAMIIMKTKELRNNCLFQIRKKYDWIFILKEIINLYVSVICVVSYLHKNEEFDHSFNPSCSLVFIIAEAAYEGTHLPGTSSSTNGMKLKLTPEILLDKRCWLMTSSPWSHDTCLFDRPDQKPSLLTSTKIEKLHH